MAWVYVAIAVGAGGFLVFILIEYLKNSSALKPKADIARNEIKQIEIKIESEKSAVTSLEDEVGGLKKEIGEIEKEIKKAEQVVAKHQESERRRKPTKFTVE